MAYREVTMIEVKEVLRQWLLGKGRKSIARRVRIDRNTVRRYIEVAKQCGLDEAAGIEALTQERLEQILEALRPLDPVGSGEIDGPCARRIESSSRNSSTEASG